MQMTQGALGFLIKRYSAVLKKCRMLNLFGSLALAGALTVGAAGLAVAADEEIENPWERPSLEINTGQKVVAPGEALTPETNQGGHYGQNVSTTQLKINGGTLELKDSNKRVVRYYHSEAEGHATPDGLVDNGMKVTMSSGAVTIESASDGDPAFGFSSLDVDTFEMADGTVTLKGTNANHWKKAAYIGAYKGMDIKGGTVTMNENSELFAGNHLYLDGGTIQMNGASSDGDADGFGNKAAHIMFTGTSENAINGAIINVGAQGNADKYAVMSAGELRMTAGQLNVFGKLLLQPDTNLGESDSIVYDRGVGDTTGTFTLSGGTVDVKAGGKIYAPWTAISQTGGTLKVNGVLVTHQPGVEPSNETYADSSYTLSGDSNSKLVISGPSDGTAYMEVGRLEIQGGSVEIGSTSNTSTAWDDGPFLGGMLSTNMSGGTVTLKKYGELYGGADSPDFDNEMNLSGTAQIKMEGPDSVLYVASADKLDVSGAHSTTLNISGNAGIEVSDKGYILSRETNMSGGTITVNSGGTLTVAGKSDKGNAVLAGITSGEPTFAQGGTFTLSGDGAITVASGGKLDFATGKVDVTMTGGTLNYSGDQLAFHDLKLAGGTQTALTGSTVLNVGAKQNTGVSVVRTLTVGDSSAAAVNLELDTLNQVAATAPDVSKVAVDNGSLTVETLNQTGGLITVGGKGAVSTLTVTGKVGTAGSTSLKNVAFTGTSDAPSAGILVANQGTLAADKAALLNTDHTGFADDTNQHAIQVAAGGTLKVTGLTSTDTFETSALSALKNALMGDSAGTLDLGGAKIGNAQSGESVNIADVGNVTSDTLKEVTGTATTDQVTTAGGVSGGFKDIKVSDAAAGTEVNVKDTLQLAGSETEGGVLAKDQNGEALALNVQNGSALTLGDQGKDNKGTVGAVTLDGTSTLNAVGSAGASFETGNITGTGGTVDVSGATLTSTGTIGTPGTGGVGATQVAAVNVAGGGTVSATSINATTLNADSGNVTTTTGDITATTLTANDGNVNSGQAITATTLTANNGSEVTAEKNITVTNAVTGLNGKITSNTGDVTLNGGATGAKGAIDAAAGDIKTTNADITVADNGTLDLTAGKNISVGTANDISATNVSAGENITAKDVTATGNVRAGETITATNVTATGDVRADKNIAASGAVTAANVSAGTGITATNGITATGNVTTGTGDIDATGADIAAANVSAGANITARDVTATGNVAATEITASGNVAAASVQAEKLAATGAVAVTGGDPAGTAPSEVGTLTAQTVTLTDGASLTAGELTMTAPGDPTAPSTLTVGSADDQRGGTTLVVEKLTLNGNSLLLDPDWGKDSTRVAVMFERSVTTDPDVSIIDGSVGVGKNSMLAIGTTDKEWLTGHVNAVTNGAGLSRDGVDSALGIFTPHELIADKGITVDGTKTSDDFTSPTANVIEGNKIKFSPNSLLVVKAEAALDPKGALSAENATEATIEGGAKLRITGAEVGVTYTVLGDNITIAAATPEGVWSGANFSTDSPMVGTGEFILSGDGEGTITPTLNSAHKVFPMLDPELADLVDAGFNNHEIGGGHVNAGAAGARFLSRATSYDYLGNNANQAAVTMESAARMALIGAVPQMTLAANNAAGNAVTQRTSLAQPGGSAIQSMASDGSVSGASAAEVAKSGFALWIMPLYQSTNGWGLEGGNFNMDYSGGLGGVAIGADYTFENAIRAGITFNIGGGYASGSGDFNETTNDMSFWGIGLYAGWTKNNFGLTADVNYTSTYNKLEQDLPAGMGMGDLKSDVTAWAISAGLRGEYKIETSALDITPHVGVRYTSLNTDEYDVKSGGTVLNGDGISQNIWTFPVGVAFSKQIETGNGWHFKPSLDLAVIPAAGDIEARGDVRFTGVSGTAELETQTMDYISYMGQAGLEFGNDSVSFGVNYNLQTGARSTSHGVFGTFRYEF